MSHVISVEKKTHSWNIAHYVKSGLSVIAFWRMRARSRKELAALPDHLLRDIGIDRTTAKEEAKKPFWRN